MAQGENRRRLVCPKCGRSIIAKVDRTFKHTAYCSFCGEALIDGDE